MEGYTQLEKREVASKYHKALQLHVCVCVFSQVRVWEIPEGGLRRNMTEAVLELYGHSRRVGLIEWHPTSSGILFSAGYDYKVPAKVKPSQRTSALLVKPLRPEAG